MNTDLLHQPLQLQLIPIQNRKFRKEKLRSNPNRSLNSNRIRKRRHRSSSNNSNRETPNLVYFNTRTFGASDNRTATENLIIDINPSELDCDAVGTPQVVTVIVTDEAGLMDTCTSLVTVLDTIAPVRVSCPLPFSVVAEASAGGAVVGDEVLPVLPH